MTDFQWLFLLGILFGIRGETTKSNIFSAIYGLMSVAFVLLSAWELFA